MKNSFFSKIKQFRYERKFYITSLLKEEVESIIKHNPALFREIYYERQINNIYFDTLEYNNYLDNVNGIERRLKVRIRWYGETFGLINKPSLEIKLKNNYLIGKLQYSLEPFVVDNELTIADIQKLFNSSKLDDVTKLYLKNLKFSLLNSYTRKYYLSADNKYRVTIDTNMNATKLFSYKNYYTQSNKERSCVILEIKYQEQDDELIGEISKYFPFRMTRSSKYVDGINRVYKQHYHQG